MIRRGHREGNKTVYSNAGRVYTPAYSLRICFLLPAFKKTPRVKKSFQLLYKKRGPGINQILDFLEVEKTILLLRQLCYQLTELPEKLLSQFVRTPLLLVGIHLYPRYSPLKKCYWLPTRHCEGRVVQSNDSEISEVGFLPG